MDIPGPHINTQPELNLPDMLVRLFSRRDTAERHVEIATTTRHLHPPRKAHERSLQQLGLTPFHERRPYATNTPVAPCINSSNSPNWLNALPNDRSNASALTSGEAP